MNKVGLSYVCQNYPFFAIHFNLLASSECLTQQATF